MQHALLSTTHPHISHRHTPCNTTRSRSLLRAVRFVAPLKELLYMSPSVTYGMVHVHKQPGVALVEVVEEPIGKAAQGGLELRR